MYHDPTTGSVEGSASTDSVRARWDLDSYRISEANPTGESKPAPRARTDQKTEKTDQPVKTAQDDPQQSVVSQSEAPNPRKPSRVLPAAIFGAGAALLATAVTFEAHLSRIDISALGAALAAAAAEVSDVRPAAPNADDPSAQIAEASLGCDDNYTYIVVPGDTLSEIAHRAYRDGTRYMPIFSANRDRLKQPDLVKAGEELRIPCP